MAVKPNERMPIWTYTEASDTVPYIKRMLCDLREGFVAIWHLYKAAGHDVDNPNYRERIRELGDEGRMLLAEFDHLGVIAYQSPLRGIALYPVLIHEGESGKLREAYFIFKDTREQIETYILADDLVVRNDLYRDERPVPEEWKQPGAVPRLEWNNEP